MADDKSLKTARHKGWLCGVALRLGCRTSTVNPYDFDTAGAERQQWEEGFEEGYNNQSA